MEWETKHSCSIIQVARLLAEKRGLDIEFAEIIGTLHDISVIETGSYANHGPKSAEIARKLLGKMKFSETEANILCNAIAHHSEKQLISGDAYVELAKDADVLDCSWYTRPENYWHLMAEKPPKIRREYMKRMLKVRKELGLPEIIPKGWENE